MACFVRVIVHSGGGLQPWLAVFHHTKWLGARRVEVLGLEACPTCILIGQLLNMVLAPQTSVPCCVSSGQVIDCGWKDVSVDQSQGGCHQRFHLHWDAAWVATIEEEIQPLNLSKKCFFLPTSTKRVPFLLGHREGFLVVQEVFPRAQQPGHRVLAKTKKGLDL